MPSSSPSPATAGFSWARIRSPSPIWGPRSGDAAENKTNKTVYFRADARAHYGTVMDAIDAVRTAGVDEVGLLTEQRQTLTKPPAAAADNKPWKTV